MSRRMGMDGESTVERSDEVDDLVYAVVVNREGRHALWKGGGLPPPGWRPSGFTGTRAECLDHLAQTGTGDTCAVPVL
jgi:MbtH protein